MPPIKAGPLEVPPEEGVIRVFSEKNFPVSLLLLTPEGGLP